MKLEATITRFAPRNGYIMDAKKAKKALEEECDFRFISPGYYLCITAEGIAYAISEYLDKIGCGCKDMTFNCTGKEICKHLIRFMSLKELPSKPIDEEMAQLLIAAGWTGTTLTPPDHPSTRHQKRGRPNVHDPDRKPAPQAAKRAKSKKSYEGKTPEQIIRETPQKKLETYASRGAPMAIAEVARRAAEKEVSA
jgi:hypothetical protein